MKKRVALIYPPHHVGQVLFSLAYLLNHLRKHNHDSEFKVIDCPAKNYDFDDLKTELLEFKPDIIGVSIPFITMLKKGKQVMEMIRKILPNSWLVVGGSHPTLCPEDVVEYCDFIVIGYGEEKMSDIVACFPNKKQVCELGGIAFSNTGRMKLNPDIIENRKTKTMGSPDWDGADIEKFFPPFIFGNKEKCYEIFTSRGCPFSCTFCSNGTMSDRRVDYRELQDVVNEIIWAKEKYNINNFAIRDEVFCIKTKVINFCNMLKEKGLYINWYFQTRVEFVKDKEMLRVMRDAGAKVVSIGIESGNEDILKLNKGVKKENMVKAVKLLKSAGLLVYAGFIIGFPQDTIDTVWETIKFPDELDLDSPGFQLMVPFPKTQVRYLAEKEGGILTNDYDKYSTYNVVYIPPGLQGYDLLAIRKFAYQYFHTRTEERLSKWIDRFKDNENYHLIKETYISLYDKKDSLNKEYLKKLKMPDNGLSKESMKRLPY